MDFEVVKEVCVEYCENMYAVGINYLNNNTNGELKGLLDKLVILEDEIRLCDDINKLFNYKKSLEQITSRIVVIINA